MSSKEIKSNESASDILQSEGEKLPSAMKSVIDLLMKQPEVEPLSNGRYKVDLDVGLERLWWHVTLWSLTSFGLLFLAMIVEDLKRGSGFAIAAACTAVFGLLYKYTDNYYVLDITQHKLLRARYFLGMGGEREVAQFSDFLGLIVEAKKSRSNSGNNGGSRVSWSYRVTGILKNKHRVPFSNFRGMTGLRGCNEFAEALSGFLEISYFPGEKFHFPNWEVGKDGLLSVKNEEYNTMWKTRFFDGLQGLLGSLSGLGILFGLYFWTF